MPIIGKPIPRDDILFLVRVISLTLESLERGSFQECDIIPLENTFRYLEDYRHDTFDWRDIHTREDVLDRMVRRSHELHAREAIHRAASAIFPGKDREWIAIALENVLMSHARGRSTDRELAKRFFAQLKKELEDQKD